MKESNEVIKEMFKDVFGKISESEPIKISKEQYANLETLLALHGTTQLLGGSGELSEEFLNTISKDVGEYGLKKLFTVDNFKNHEPVYEIDEYDTKRWYLNGELQREDGPAIEYASGTKYWYLNGKLHREDGPAVEWNNGEKEWFLNGKRHRVDGPAIEWNDGDKRWYLNGVKLTEKEFNARMK